MKSRVVAPRREPPPEPAPDHPPAAERAPDAAQARPLYLATTRDPVFAMAHLPASTRSGATGIVLCPPFGWHDMSTYRTRRAWAFALARAGHPAIRIDLPGTGDSGGSPRDPDRVGAWLEAVATAARWLREEAQCGRIAGLGIGLGGMMAWLAAAQGAPIDDLVLWAVPSRGRRLVREIEAFARFELGAAEAGEEAPAPAPGDAPAGGGPSPAATDDLVDAAGQIMTKETVGAIASLDLTKRPLTDPGERRVLVLECDGVTTDKRVPDHFEAAGADVTVASGDGYGAMMQYARYAAIPHATIARSIAWLADAGERATSPIASLPSPPVHAAPTLELRQDGAAIRETPVTIELESGDLFGVLTEPADEPVADVCGILFNSGSDRRTGPHRMWVETARRWAARGVPTVRIDQRGIGDSDGDEHSYDDVSAYFDDRVTRRSVALMDALEARGLPGRFILVGHCSSAYWCVQGALADRRVAGAFPIDLPFFFVTWWAVHVNHGWLIQRKPRADDPRPKAAALWALKRAFRLLPLCRRVVRSMRPRPDRIDAALNRLGARGTELFLAFGPHEPLYRELVGDRRIDSLNARPGVRVTRIPGNDVRFRPVALQRFVSDQLDEALTRVLPADGRADVPVLHIAERA